MDVKRYLMAKSERNILEVLQAELVFIEKGGYGRHVRTPWKARSPLQDSPTCLNYAYLEKAHSCSRCELINFVPDENKNEQVPCHFIPLNESGQTIDQLESRDNQHQLEAVLKTWCSSKIKELEGSRLASDQLAAVP
jgi:hypothetical protein